MKAKYFLSVVLALILLVPVTALAAASPTLGKVTVSTSESKGVVSVSLKEPTVADTAVLNNAIATYLGSNPGTTLLTIDLDVVMSGDSAEIVLQVQGVRAGENIVVVHLKSNGQVEYIPAKVLGDGKISFTMTSYSPISIIRVDSAAYTALTATQTIYPTGIYFLPQTGETYGALPMAALLAGSLLALGLGVTALRRTRPTA